MFGNQAQSLKAHSLSFRDVAVNEFASHSFLRRAWINNQSHKPKPGQFAHIIGFNFAVACGGDDS